MQSVISSNSGFVQFIFNQFNGLTLFDAPAFFKQILLNLYFEIFAGLQRLPKRREKLRDFLQILHADHFHR